jgi:peptide deformylase
LQLQLRFYGDPILRKVCDPVTVFDADLRAFAEAMIETMFREQGIGLAGPQVGAQPVALVNPKVTSRSRETWIFEEGCLSLPEIRGEVMRVERATVHYQDLEGKAQEIEAEGMFARILLHEIDHLDGRLFIDYLSAARKSLLKPKLREIASRESA